MIALGMLMLGAFMGYIIAYGLRKIEDWKNPASAFAAVVSAAFSGGLFAFIQYMSRGQPLGEGIFFYPIGLAYGALLPHLDWIVSNTTTGLTTWKVAHAGAVTLATLLLLSLLLCPWLRGVLPKIAGGPA
jgi:hypothetical protein